MERTIHWSRFYKLTRILCQILAVAAIGWTARALAGAGAPPPDVKAVVAQMEEHNRQREALLKNFAVDRTYEVENKRFHTGAKTSATMIYIAPFEKVFEIHSFSGSGFIRKGVINRIIEAEIRNATAELKPKSAITSDNYEFTWVKSDTIDGRPQYVLHAKPRRKDPYLFDANVWIDAEDFVITRIQGRPAKNPSFWTRRVDFTHQYEKIGDFWLPVHTSSVAHVFLFGITTTEMRYSNYQINQPGLAERAAEIQKRGDKLEIQMDSKDKQRK